MAGRYCLTILSAFSVKLTPGPLVYNVPADFCHEADDETPAQLCGYHRGTGGRCAGRPRRVPGQTTGLAAGKTKAAGCFPGAELCWEDPTTRSALHRLGSTPHSDLTSVRPRSHTVLHFCPLLDSGPDTSHPRSTSVKFYEEQGTAFPS